MGERGDLSRGEHEDPVDHHPSVFQHLPVQHLRFRDHHLGLVLVLGLALGLGLGLGYWPLSGERESGRHGTP